MSRKIVDLTFPIHEGMTTYPSHWHPLVEITLLGRHGIENRETRKLLLGSHTGTHCDAPRHFVPGGQTVDALSLQTLIGPALVLDFSEVRPKQQVDVPDSRKNWVTESRASQMRFDWSEQWGNDIILIIASQTAARFLTRGPTIPGLAGKPGGFMVHKISPCSGGFW
jgi:kynurenine formamidase